MSRALVVLPQAQADVDRHAAYLDDQGPGLGDRFLSYLQRGLTLLEGFPHAGSPWQGHSLRTQDLRHLALRRFPIWIFYSVDGERDEQTVTVIRVLDQRRDLTDDLT